LTRRYSVAVTVAALVVVVDVITKRWASMEFVGQPLVLIPGFLSFTYAENPGSALSLFQNAGPVLGIAAIAISIAVLVSLRRDRPMMEVVAFGLVIGGALGNFVDRLFRGSGFLDGKVIDWINLWWIPTFNVADMAITFAVSLLFIQSWLTRSDS
jgi:signal peptidase II